MTFFCLPLIIDNLGLEKYGVFSIIGIIGNLNLLANLGISTTLLKLLSEQGKSQESQIDIMTAILILIIIVLPLSALLLFFKEWVLFSAMSIPLTYKGESEFLFIFLVICSFFSVIGQILVAILDSQNKNYLSNGLQTFYTVLYWFSIVLLFTVKKDANLVSVGVCILITTFLWFMFLLFFSYNTWGSLFTPMTIKCFKYSSRKQLRYSLKVFSGSLLSFLFEPLTKILISKLLGVKEVGILDIVLRLKAQIWGVLIKIVYPIAPLIAAQSLKENKNLIKQMQFLLLCLIIPGLIVFTFSTSDIISIWLKRDDEILTQAITIILPAYLLSSIVIPVYYYFLYTGRAELIIFLQFFNVIVNAFVIVVLYSSIGFASVILSMSISILVALIINLILQKKILAIMPFENYPSLFLWLFNIIFLSSFAIWLNSINVESSYRLLAIIIISTITSLIYYIFVGNKVGLLLNFKKSRTTRI